MTMPEEAKRKKYHYFLDAKKYETDHQYLSGLQIKQEGGISADYQLYLEEEGDTPDRAVSDGETMDFAGRIKHFYAVPPATFGAQ